VEAVLAVGDRVAYLPDHSEGGDFDGLVADAIPTSAPCRYRVEWSESAPGWFDRKDLVSEAEATAFDAASHCSECKGPLVGSDGRCGNCADAADDDDGGDYTVTLTLNVTASSVEEAIRHFLDDANNGSLVLNYDVTDSDGDVDTHAYEHNDEEDD